jgi:hypothetical protein
MSTGTVPAGVNDNYMEFLMVASKKLEGGDIFNVVVCGGCVLR